MNCIWHSLLTKIKDDDFKIIMKKYNPNLKDLFLFVKSKNKLCTNIRHQDKFLTRKEYKENLNTIENLEFEEISLGYCCSSCEPVLLLVAELFKIQINHNFNNSIIKYYSNNLVRYSIQI